MGERVLVTGAAGFIGYHVCRRLLIDRYDVIGFDNLNSYYDISLKEDRLTNLINLEKKDGILWEFIKGDLENKSLLLELFEKYQPNIVINLAAQAGVRYSLESPESYISANLVGFSNILECCRVTKIKHLIYASSSSVYGANSKIPFSENDMVDKPISLYAATKKSNELMAHSYSHLYNFPSTGLRLFTIYGPWGRPDMAPMIFTKAIIERKPLKIFNQGNMSRDFTFIDDAVEYIIRLINKIPRKNSEAKDDKENLIAPARIVNIANGNKVNICEFISLIEKELNIKAIKVFEDMQKGDVRITSANKELIESLTNYKPLYPIQKGIKKFINWYKTYYCVN